MELLDKFLAQVGQIQSVWMPFVIAAAVVAWLAYLAVQNRFQTRIEHLESRLSLRDDELSAVKRKMEEMPLELAREASAEPPTAAPRQPDPESAAIEPAEPDVQRSDGRVILGRSVTPELLIDLHMKHTALQADRLAAPYIGKWLRLQGKVGNVSTRSNEQICVALTLVPITSATLAHPLAMTTTLLYFSPDAAPELETLQLNDEIAVLGKIEEIGYMSLILEECELIG